MLIEIHAIQNHSPANLNRDDLGAPKTCYFGGVLRSRISSQCIKRSIRTSEQFKALLGGVATRRLAQLIAAERDDDAVMEKALRVLKLCGIAPKDKKGNGEESDDDKSAGRVFTTRGAVREMSSLLRAGKGKSDAELAKEFARIIASENTSPDMALCGRMLEPKKPEKSKDKGGGNGATDVWKGLDLTVEAALQAAHAISTHEARPEVDYYVAADDVPGDDAGAAFVDEAMFASACFYKYFSINWEALVENLKGNEKLAAHTVGAFIRAAALTTPTGKQNSFAAHNAPDGILVEFKQTPLSYANAFAMPAKVTRDRDIVAQSIWQLGNYLHDLEVGYGKPETRIWFSPNGRNKLTYADNGKELAVDGKVVGALDELVAGVMKALKHDWAEVQKAVCV